MAAPPSTSPASPTPTTKRPLLQHPWRVAVVVIALLVVVNLGIFLLAGTDTSSPSSEGLPSTVEAITPQNGAIIEPVDTIGIDLRDDLTGVLQVSCPSKGISEEIPEDQLDRVVPLGEITFRPGPAKDVTRWPTGICTVWARYWPQAKPRPENPPAYSWTFRVGA